MRGAGRDARKLAGQIDQNLVGFEIDFADKRAHPGDQGQRAVGPAEFELRLGQAQVEPGGLAEALGSLADDAALRRRLGNAARERVAAAFSWKAHCSRLDEALTAALEARAASGRDPGAGYTR